MSTFIRGAEIDHCDQKSTQMSTSEIAWTTFKGGLPELSRRLGKTSFDNSFGIFKQLKKLLVKSCSPRWYPHRKIPTSYNKLAFTTGPNIWNMIRSVITVTTNLFFRNAQISETRSQSYNKLVFPECPNIWNMIRSVIKILLYGAKILLRQARLGAR